MMKVYVVNILRKKYTNKLRYYYDLWHMNMKNTKLIDDMKTKHLELIIGLQQVESEREYVKHIEKANSQLKMTLFLTIFFYKWKSKISLHLLNSERKKYEEEKSIIYNELIKLRKVIHSANNLEFNEMKSAKAKGEQLSSSLIHLGEKLHSLIKVNRTYRVIQEEFQQTHAPVANNTSAVTNSPASTAATGGASHSGQHLHQDARSHATTGMSTSGGAGGGVGLSSSYSVASTSSVYSTNTSTNTSPMVMNSVPFTNINIRRPQTQEIRVDISSRVVGERDRVGSDSISINSGGNSHNPLSRKKSTLTSGDRSHNASSSNLLAGSSSKERR
jgi:hypothetical protein